MFIVFLKGSKISRITQSVFITRRTIDERVMADYLSHEGFSFVTRRFIIYRLINLCLMDDRCFPLQDTSLVYWSL